VAWAECRLGVRDENTQQAGSRSDRHSARNFAASAQLVLRMDSKKDEHRRGRGRVNRSCCVAFFISKEKKRNGAFTKVLV
jgi:hypothetical protein